MSQKMYNTLLQHPWRIASTAVGGMMIILCGLLWWEHRALQHQSLRIQQLQSQYHDYLDKVKRIIRKQRHEPSDEEAQADSEEDSFNSDESFMRINRAPEYLKESTVTYLKAQQMDSLLARMSPSAWQHYTDQLLMRQQEPRISKKRTKKSRYPSSRLRIRSHSQLQSTRRIMPEKRDSITGITFAWPLTKESFWLSSFFGPRKKQNGAWGFHYGLDMASPRGTPVQASADGIVELAGYVSGYGNTVIVSHDKIYKTRYAHLHKIYTRKGAHVTRGQKLGAVGATGFTISSKSGKDASHLHFELYERGKQINPLCMLPRL